MHITLTGNLGSGKSTISKIMSSKYGFEIYSTGTTIRELAAERGLTVLEMNELMGRDHSFDNTIDERTRQVSLDRKDDLFFDSRLAWHFAVNTFKVFLSVDIDEAARRVFSDDRGETESYKTQDDARAQLIARAHNEDARYKEIYDIDYFQIKNYNLILDSTFSNPDLLASIILDEKKRYEDAVGRGETPKTRIILSPARLAGRKRGNDNDNDIIREIDAGVSMKIESFNVEYGMDEIKKCADADIEFVSVKGVE